MQTLKKIIIFDLDHTLFDTAKFKVAYFGQLKRFGVPLSVANKYYRKSMRTGSVRRYDYRPLVHLRLLRRDCKFDVAKAKAQMDSVFQSAERFLFPGATQTLQRLSKQGFELVLLSRGSRSFNMRKIQTSGLQKYFSKIFIIRGNKYRFLKKILPRLVKKVWMVNDDLSELSLIARKYPFIQGIWHHRKGFNHPKNSQFRVIKEIPEIIRIVS